MEGWSAARNDVFVTVAAVAASARPNSHGALAPAVGNYYLGARGPAAAHTCRPARRAKRVYVMVQVSRQPSLKGLVVESTMTGEMRQWRRPKGRGPETRGGSQPPPAHPSSAKLQLNCHLLHMAQLHTLAWFKPALPPCPAGRRPARQRPAAGRGARRPSRRRRPSCCWRCLPSARPRRSSRMGCSQGDTGGAGELVRAGLHGLSTTCMNSSGKRNCRATECPRPTAKAAMHPPTLRNPPNCTWQQQRWAQHAARR